MKMKSIIALLAMSMLLISCGDEVVETMEDKAVEAVEVMEDKAVEAVETMEDKVMEEETMEDKAM